MYLVFFLFWIIFNGQITAEIILFGLVIAGVMYAFVCRFMDYSPARDRIVFHEIFYILQYIGILIAEIVKANMSVVRLILTSRCEPEPVIVRFRTDLQTKTAKVVLANSITLTPGTITASLEGDELIVHCLDRAFAEGMEDSVFVKLLKRMEQERVS